MKAPQPTPAPRAKAHAPIGDKYLCKLPDSVPSLCMAQFSIPQPKILYIIGKNTKHFFPLP